MMMKGLLLIFVSVMCVVSCSGTSETNQLGGQKLASDPDSLGVTKTEHKIDAPTTSDDIWVLIEEKADWFKKGTHSKVDIKGVPDSFASFYEKFISDSLFQYNHIDFTTLIGVIGECDTTVILKSNNWKFTDWNFKKFFPVDNFTNSPDGWENRYYSSSNKFYYEFRLKEVGLIYQTGFELLNGEWMLTLYYVNAC